MKYFLIVYFFLLPTDVRSKELVCSHFWTFENNKSVKTKKAIGQDLGKDLPTSRGKYRCKIELAQNDLDSSRYIYIGEVGDSSYIEVVSHNGSKVQDAYITHGLSPNESISPTNYRIIPFYFGVKDIWLGPGSYVLDLHYKDLIRMQSGLRSGPPEVVGLRRLILKTFKNSMGFTYNLLQILLLLTLFFSFAFWPKLSLNRRVLFSLATLSSGIALLNHTGIPRIFYANPIMLRINDASAFILFTLFFASLLTFFKVEKHISTLWLRYHYIPAVLLSVFGFMSSRRMPENLGYSTLLLFSFSAFIFLYCMRQGKIKPKRFPEPPKYFSWALFIFAIFYIIDVTNLLLLESRFYYICVYLTVPALIVFLQKTLSHEHHCYSDFLGSLHHLKAETLKSLGEAGLNSQLSLNALIEKTAALFNANRASISEISEGNTHFLGVYGDYNNVFQSTPISEANVLSKSYTSRKDEMGKSVDGHDYLVIPIFHNTEISSFVSITDFKDNKPISPFYLDNLELIKNEIGVLVNLAIIRKQINAKTILLETMRATVHPLQIQSEEHFLKHFRINEENSEHPFIIGDLVGSTPLNELFGSDAVANAMDEYLFSVWDNFKDQGVVLNRTKGDAVSILVPNLLQDSSSTQSITKTFNILKHLNNDSKLSDVARSHGVLAPMQFRFVMGKIATKVQELGQVKSFNLLADPAIDGATRVLDNVVKPGECIVVESVINQIQTDSDFIEVSPERLRGKFKNIRCFSLVKPKKNEAQSA